MAIQFPVSTVRRGVSAWIFQIPKLWHWVRLSVLWMKTLSKLHRYAEEFERFNAELMALPKYAELRDKFSATASSVRNSYFTQDKKGVLKDNKSDTLADDDTYYMIIKDKEWLMSLQGYGNRCRSKSIFRELYQWL